MELVPSPAHSRSNSSNRVSASAVRPPRRSRSANIGGHPRRRQFRPLVDPPAARRPARYTRVSR
jgi:hypothetical protein